MDSIDCLVIGAGVVGLAIARQLAAKGLEVAVFERENTVGSGVSSRNSGVIHAGLYYPTNSLKARLCVRGRELLYDYCQKKNIPHARLGKILVACSEQQEQKLEAIARQAKTNGVLDLVRLTPREVNDLEPEIRCSAAYYSPSTGILDVHELMGALTADVENYGGYILLNTEFVSATPTDFGFEILYKDPKDARISSRYLINAAGLSSTSVAQQIQTLESKHIPTAYMARGTYFKLNRRHNFRHLVYPMPDEAGLGIHLTLDLNGGAKFGPDVEWLNEQDYTPDPTRAPQFYEAIREFWPSLPDGSLTPDYCGIRPKISGPGEPAADFVIQSKQTHDITGLVNLFGIESPGVTCSLALAANVEDSLL